MANTIESIEITNPFGVVDTTAKVTVTAQDYLSLEAIEEAGEHTLQMWVKADSAKTITFIQNENKKFAVNTSWTRIVWTFNADVSEVLVLLPIGTYYFYNTKIEKGNIDTDYTRAPEDTDKEITELVTKYSEVKQTVDGITTTVGKHTTEISDLGTKVTATETVANQTAEQFKWIVKSGTSETDFTLTDRTASLVSEYINLNGLVTFSGLNSETQNKINGGIASVDVMYAQSTSNTTAPTSGWTTTAPAWKDGYYMWQKTVTTYKDGTSVETSATVLTGATGQNGKDGKDGTSVTILGSYDTEDELNSVHPTGNIGDAYMVSGDLYVWNGSAWQNVGQIKGDTGATGVGVLAITEQYYLSTSNTGQAGGSWSTDEPEWKSGCYIWTRSKIDYDNETTSYTTPVLAKAINGANTNASNAVSTANTASTNASNALTTAGTANATASQAKVDASNAVSTANSASSTANSALEIAESIDDTISEWCYENDRTIINGGKIATGTIAAEAIKAKAITADKIDITDLSALGATIGGWDISSKAIYKSTNSYVPPLRSYTEKIKAYLLGTGTLTSAELEYFDINADGAVNVKDSFYIQQIARGLIDYSAQSGAMSSPLEIVLDATDGTKTIRFTATNPIGETIESYVGAIGCNFPFIIGDSVFGSTVEGGVVQTSSGVDLATVNENVEKLGTYKALTLINRWTGSLYARYDELHKVTHITGRVYASSSVTNFSFCDLVSNGLPEAPVYSALSEGVPCVKSGNVLCSVYAYSNRYLTLATNTSVPAYVSIDFWYK